MNDPTKIKVLAVTTVLMMMLNVVIVSVLWFALPAPPTNTKPGTDRGEFIVRELQLDEAQQRQFEHLRDDHHHIINTVNEKDRHTHDVLFDLIKIGSDTTAVTDSLINEIAENRKQIEYATYKHLAQIRKICNPGQQKKFDDIIVNLMTRRGEGSPPLPSQ